MPNMAAGVVRRTADVLRARPVDEAGPVDRKAMADMSATSETGGRDGGDGAPGPTRGGAYEAPVTVREYRTLTVIVPVFNERSTMAEIIRRIRAVDVPVTVDVIAVDDGSSDGTDKVLAALEDAPVRVLTHRVNQGKGAAIRSGLAVARGDLVLIQDGDLEYDPEDWPRLLDPILRGKGRGVHGSR